MEDFIKKLEIAIHQLSDYISRTEEEKVSVKLNPEKWSKKEIVGHLVDSGINNLQRFTEIQFMDNPYYVRDYNQDALVRVNNYQQEEIKNIFELLVSLNRRIIKIIRNLSEEVLSCNIVLPNHEQFTLKYLIEDYVYHFEHHVNQIIEST